MADLTENSHLIGMVFLSMYGVDMDLKAGLLLMAGSLNQMIQEGEWVGDQPVNLP